MKCNMHVIFADEWILDLIYIGRLDNHFGESFDGKCGG